MVFQETKSSNDEAKRKYHQVKLRTSKSIHIKLLPRSQKTQETVNRVTQLKSENSVLEEKVKNLTKELGFLKELFLAHASSTTDSSKFQGIDLQRLLSDNPDGSSTKEKVKNLTKELGFLKELFLAHASSTTDSSKFQGIDLQRLLSDNPDGSSTSNDNNNSS
ncbi:hypothetical protein FQR65_LT10911 [Abscondita terminalis]|nr:hypothetical protein FQR65_LT10911 [Abscondita terminalis]